VKRQFNVLYAVFTSDLQLNPFTRELDEVDKRYDGDNLDGTYGFSKNKTHTFWPVNAYRVWHN